MLMRSKINLKTLRVLFIWTFRRILEILKFCLKWKIRCDKTGIIFEFNENFIDEISKCNKTPQHVEINKFAKVKKVFKFY